MERHPKRFARGRENLDIENSENAVDMTNQMPIDFGPKQDRYVRFAVDNLSQITKFPAWESFSKFVH